MQDSRRISGGEAGADPVGIPGWSARAPVASGGGEGGGLFGSIDSFRWYGIPVEDAGSTTGWSWVTPRGQIVTAPAPSQIGSLGFGWLSDHGTFYAAPSAR